MGIYCALVLIGITGCATNRQYHGPMKSAAEQKARPKLPETNIYDIKVDHPKATEVPRMGFIEFDDTGSFWNAKQLTNILDDIKKQEKKLVVFVFIHGWQNSAKVWGDLNHFDPDPEGDVQRFKNFLLLMSHTPHLKASGRQVYGVFLGWRGELVSKGNDPVVQQPPPPTPPATVSPTPAAAPAAAPPADWMPLGVWALTQEEKGDAVMFFQISVNKDGMISGGYQNVMTGESKPIAGSVDKQSQRAAWHIGDNQDTVIETGLFNLTKDVTTVAMHFGKDKTQTWLMVRLPAPQLPSAPTAVDTTAKREPPPAVIPAKK